MGTNVASLVLGLVAILLLVSVNGAMGSQRNAQEATQGPLRDSKLYDAYGNYMGVPTGGMAGGRRGRGRYPYYGNYPGSGYGYPYGNYPDGRGGIFPGGEIDGDGMFPRGGNRGSGMFPGGGMGGRGMYPGFPGRGQFTGFSPSLCPFRRCCSFLPDGSCNFCCPPTVFPTPPRGP